MESREGTGRKGKSGSEAKGRRGEIGRRGWGFGAQRDMKRRDEGANGGSGAGATSGAEAKVF